MINYQKVSARCQSLQNQVENFLRDKIPFNWHPEHQEEFKLMRKEIARPSVLAYYNPRNKNSNANRCKHGRSGCMLVATRKAVYFASKALTEVQKGYVVIEIESLVVAWPWRSSLILVCKTTYLGNRSEASRSHFVQILNQVTLRLQRILIKSFSYHFTVHYIPCVINQLANCLSRLGGQKDTNKLPKLHLCQILTNYVQVVNSFKSTESVHTSR